MNEFLSSKGFELLLYPALLGLGALLNKFGERLFDWAFSRKKNNHDLLEKILLNAATHLQSLEVRDTAAQKHIAELEEKNERLEERIVELEIKCRNGRISVIERRSILKQVELKLKAHRLKDEEVFAMIADIDRRMLEHGEQLVTAKH